MDRSQTGAFAPRLTTMSAVPTTFKRARGGTQPLPLSLDHILRVALPLLASEGVEGLTIRSVADELGVSSPAVYHYLAGRDELIDRLCEQVAAEVDVIVPAGAAWDDGVVTILLNMHLTFARYPGVGERVLHTRRHSPAALALSAAVRAQLRAGGYADDAAERVRAGLQMLFGGWLSAPHPSPDVLEQAIRWLLDGSRKERKP